MFWKKYQSSVNIAFFLPQELNSKYWYRLVLVQIGWCKKYWYRLVGAKSIGTDWLVQKVLVQTGWCKKYWYRLVGAKSRD